MTRVLDAASAAMHFTGPPPDRMAGRAAARMARAAAPQGNYTPKAKPDAPAAPAAQTRVSAATEARANAFLARESLLDDAVNCGVIGANLRDHYARCFDADPEGTRAYLHSIGLGRSTAHAAQTTQAASEQYDATHLSEAERTRIAAAREGRSPRIINGGL